MIETMDQNEKISHLHQLTTAAVGEYFMGVFTSHPDFDPLNKYVKDINVTCEYSDDDTRFKIVAILNAQSDYDRETSVELKLAQTNHFPISIDIFNNEIEQKILSLAARSFKILKFMAQGKQIQSLR